MTGRGTGSVAGSRSRTQVAKAGDAGGGGSDGASTALYGTRMNSAGNSCCYNCGKEAHWARECPHLSTMQQDQLHMVLEREVEEDQEGQTAHQFFHLIMLQADELPDDHAYLDGCSKVTAFKTKKCLENLRRVKQGVKINCNSGAMHTNIVGDYGYMTAWFIPEGIATIFLMSELKKRYPITYDSWQGYYVVHTMSGEVRFYKDENRLLYIDLEGSLEGATALLIQTAS
jgi:hypothetical protein